MLVSARLKRVVSFVEDEYNLHAVIIFTLVMEPIVWLTKNFMAAAAKTAGTSPPLLQNLATSRFSPIVRVLQHLRGLMSGKSPRCILLWGFAKCSSFDNFVLLHPRSARLLRRICLLVSAALYRRLHWQSQRPPWRLAAIGDSRVLTCEKQRVASSALCLRPCCMDPLFLRVL